MSFWFNVKNPTLEEALGLLLAPIDKFRDLFREFPEQQKHENITGTLVEKSELRKIHKE